jgi:sulfur relay (sulfurtransferase) DsrF/TusC family protein
MSNVFKISTSTELMYNYKQFELFDQKDAFDAVQTKDGHSMLFGESTDGKLYLVLEQSGTGIGWAKIELTKELGGKVKTFSVAQNHTTGNIHLAVAMDDPTGASKLYTCMNLSSDNLDWTQQKINWQYKVDDRVGTGNTKLIIDDIHLSESNSGDEYLIIDTDNGNGFVDRFWINNQLMPAWNKHPLAFNISADIANKSEMGRKKGEPVDGIYTFGAENNTPQFVYTPIYNPFAPSSAPNPTNFDLSATGITHDNGSFAICKALSGAADATDIFLAGNGALYYIAAENQNQLAKPQQILQHDLLKALRELQASVHNGRVVIWGLNNADQIFYLSCDVVQVRNAASWSTPLPLLSNVSEISHYIDKASGGITIFANAGDGVIRKGIQDAKSSKWLFGRIELPVVESTTPAQKVKSFTTSIRVTDENNNPQGNTAVKLTPKARTSVYINHVYYVLSGETITVNTDATGVLNIVEWVDDISGTKFDVAIGQKSVAVSPTDGPLAKMKNLGTVSALEQATVTNHDGSTSPLIPSNLSANDKKALAQVISNLNDAHDSITGNGSANKSFVTVGAAVNTPLDYVETFWGDLVQSLEHFGDYVINTIKDAATNAWHFIVNIGDKVYGFIIDTAEKVAGALKSIWNKIVKGFEDLWEYLKFLFKWKDILLTRDVFKQTVKIFLHKIGEDIQIAKHQMDNAIDGAESVIREWANPTTTHPSLDKNNTAINATLNGKENNPSLHSAPSEMLKSHFVGNIKSSTITQAASTAASDPTWAGLTDLSDFMDREKATIDDLRQQIMALFVSNAAQQQNPDLETILKKIVADIAIAALDLFKMAADKILDFLTLLIYEAIDLLDAPIYIPILSDILKDLFNIELPSILDVLCLVAAVPTTIVYKAMNGHAPYESKNGSIHDKITKAKTFAELQANFQQSGEKITLDKDAQNVLFETFYLLSGIATVINGVLLIIDEETEGGASSLLSTPKSITSVLSSASLAIASLFSIPAGIKNNTMNTFASVLSKTGIASTVGFAVAPKVIAKVKGIKGEGPVKALKIQIDFVENGAKSLLAFIGIVPQVYHIFEAILDDQAPKAEKELSVMESTQGVTSRLSTIAGFAGMIDVEPITKEIIILVQGLLIAVTAGIQIAESETVAINN